MIASEWSGVPVHLLFFFPHMACFSQTDLNWAKREWNFQKSSKPGSCLMAQGKGWLNSTHVA